jgi:hypothetical protein
MVYLQREEENLRKKQDRAIDKEIGRIYRVNEQAPGESYQDFKRRFKKTDQYKILKKQVEKIYKPWERMPDEPEKDFKRRLSSKKAVST